MNLRKQALQEIYDEAILRGLDPKKYTEEALKKKARIYKGMTRSDSDEVCKIAAKFNAHGFDANREVGDLPYFVGLKEWKERHGDVLEDEIKKEEAWVKYRRLLEPIKRVIRKFLGKD